RMRLNLVMTVFVCAFLFLSLAEGGGNISASNRSNNVSHPFLAADYFGNRIVRVDAEGAVLWSHEAPHPQDAWLLPNGNVLFCHQLGQIKAPDPFIWRWSDSEGPSNGDMLQKSNLFRHKVLYKCSERRME
ncbi:MAG: hypothetical protein KAR47_12685, partial [Planctomycetes bacterium]|nr:hypothetical protein [Planctomycetota bacterium]